MNIDHTGVIAGTVTPVNTQCLIFGEVIYKFFMGVTGNLLGSNGNNVGVADLALFISFMRKPVIRHLFIRKLRSCRLSKWRIAPTSKMRQSSTDSRLARHGEAAAQSNRE
jgi:hypothetical protein